VQFLLYIVAVVIMLEAAVLVVLNRRLICENQYYHEYMTVLFIRKLELEAENYQLKKRLIAMQYKSSPAAIYNIMHGIN